MTRKLIDDLNDLHGAYSHAVNLAVDSGDLTAAEDLAKAYDDEAWELVAEWEGMTHLLPRLRRAAYDTPLRRLVRRFSRLRAA